MQVRALDRGEITMPAKITLNVNGKAATVNVGDAEVVADLSAWRNEKPPGVAAPAVRLARA
jgi:hypothetical protein